MTKILVQMCLPDLPFDFGWGSDPEPTGGAFSTPPDPLAGFNGDYF